MEIIKNLYTKLALEKSEKETDLEYYINTKGLAPSLALEESFKILKDIAVIDIAINALEQYIDKPNN